MVHSGFSAIMTEFTKLQQRPEKPKLFTLWPFTEKVAIFVASLEISCIMLFFHVRFPLDILGILHSYTF